MVDLQNLKNAVAGSPLTEETKKELNAILDAAIARGFITPEEQQKAQAMINLEMQATQVAEDTEGKIINLLDKFISQGEADFQEAAEDMDEMSDEEKAQIAEEPAAAPAETTPAPTMTATEQPAEAAMPAAPVMPTTPATEVPPQPPTQ